MIWIRSHNWQKSFKELGIILACGITNGVLMCPSCLTNDPPLMAKIISVSCFIWLVMWKGNSYTSHIVDHFYSWLKDPVKRLVYGVIGHSVYTTLATIAIVYGLEYFFSIQVGKLWQTAFISICIALFVSLVLHSKEFLISWRRLAIESEKIKKEAITSKYETLKNQVNPHFLFNSLNALTHLVYENQDLAAKFIKKLSEVYRYVLESRDKELVLLETEMEFVNSYIFLQKIRYEENLIFESSIENLKDFLIVPLSLQMLVENAIKHNEISAESPLRISFLQDEDYLLVTNNLQKKKILSEGGSEIGLANIKARFSFLSDKEVIIEQNKLEFIVKLPLFKETPKL